MTPTTIEENYITSPIIKNWLTIQVKLENKDNKTKPQIDFDKFDIVFE